VIILPLSFGSNWTGGDLTVKFREHLQSIPEDLELQEGIEVMGLEKNVVSFQVDCSNNQSYFAKAIIIASGKNPRHLGVPGEEKFFGKGVAVCATCDAPLYKQKDVAVIGGGNSALDAVLALSKVARNVYLVNVNQSVMGDEILKHKVEIAGNVHFKNQSKTISIQGDRSVTSWIFSFR
jgi:thioredoxin reductase